MRKLLMVMAVIMAVVMAAGMASATLLGIKGSYEGNRPDIDFNNTGVVNYDADENLFTLTATDEKLVLPDGTVYWLSGGEGYTTTLSLQIHVDKTGNLTSGITGYDMVEQVTTGSVTIADVTYNAGDVLLQADVKAFGWGTGTGGVPAFDFLFDTISGGLVDQGLWPTTPLTAAWVETENKSYSWTSDFTLGNAKGDKMTTPEPTTLLLLGSGLIGLAGIGRKTLKR